jgi:hypothetical protein
MKKSRILFLVFLLVAGFFTMSQRGFFLPEVALAGECKVESLESPKTKMHLIELYTSEGCSSCPPAEKWINSLRSHPELGKSFFPMSFHVDYWDYIGWRDPLAKMEHSKRQRAYAAKWRSRSVYTPGFIKNGQEWRGLPVRSLPKPSSSEVGILKADSLGNDKFKLNFSGNNSNLRINYARLGNGINSKVSSGENSGKNLKHFFVVLEHYSSSFKNNMEITIPKSEVEAKEYMVAIWLDDPDSMKSIQAVGGCL